MPFPNTLPFAHAEKLSVGDPNYSKSPGGIDRILNSKCTEHALAMQIYAPALEVRLLSTRLHRSCSNNDATLRPI